MGGAVGGRYSRWEIQQVGGTVGGRYSRWEVGGTAGGRCSRWGAALFLMFYSTSTTAALGGVSM